MTQWPYEASPHSCGSGSTALLPTGAHCAVCPHPTPLPACPVAQIHRSTSLSRHFGPPPQAAEANFAPPKHFLASNAQPWLWGVEATEAKQSRLGEGLRCNSAKQSRLRPDPPDAYKT